MLRLNLGDLLTWRGEEHVVIAARAHAAMLRRLVDDDTVWVDVPCQPTSTSKTSFG